MYTLHKINADSEVLCTVNLYQNFKHLKILLVNLGIIS